MESNYNPQYHSIFLIDYFGISQDQSGRVLDKYCIISRDEEGIALQQFARFAETRNIAQDLMLQESKPVQVKNGDILVKEPFINSYNSIAFEISRKSQCCIKWLQQKGTPHDLTCLPHMRSGSSAIWPRQDLSVLPVNINIYSSIFWSKVQVMLIQNSRIMYIICRYNISGIHDIHCYGCNDHVLQWIKTIMALLLLLLASSVKITRWWNAFSSASEAQNNSASASARFFKQSSDMASRFFDTKTDIHAAW